MGDKRAARRARRHEQDARKLLTRIAARRYTAPERMLPVQVPHGCTPAGEAAAPATAPGTVPAPKNCQIDRVFHGRLRQRAAAWRELNASDEVMGMVTGGYVIDWGPPLTECNVPDCNAMATDNSYQCPRHRQGPAARRLPVPPQEWHCPRNHTGVRDNMEWALAAVDELVKFGSVYECAAPPDTVMPLNVEPKSTPGRFRLCHDLRHINACVRRSPFKMETLQRMRGLLRKGRFACSIDLSSSYYHLDVAEDGPDGDSTRWLGFAIDRVDDGGTCSTHYYRFCSLPFGLRSACKAFTTLMSTLINHWRASLGLELIGYLDDHATFADTAAAAEEAAATMVADLQRLGFVVNLEKSELRASQCFTFLGARLCLADGVFRVPQQRLAKLTATIVSIVAQGHATARQLYKVAGQICSMTIARGTRACATYTRAMYSACYDASAGHANWDTPRPLTDDVMEELAYWYAVRDHDGCQPMQEPEFTASKTFYTDASEFAAGAHEDSARQRIVCRVDLPRSLRGASSAARELFGVDECVAELIASGRIGNGDRVAIGTDAQCAAYGVMRGSSKKPVNHRLIKSILERAAAAGVQLAIFWVPRDCNERADDISKIPDKHGYGLSAAAFSEISAAFGGHDVDGFASRANARCQAFVARWPDAKAEAVNAFRQNWADGRRWWLFPPAPIVHRAVRKIACGGACATLVVPVTPQADWWPILFPRGRPAAFVGPCRRVPADAVRRRTGCARHTARARDAALLAIDIRPDTG